MGSSCVDAGGGREEKEGEFAIWIATHLPCLFGIFAPDAADAPKRALVPATATAIYFRGTGKVGARALLTLTARFQTARPENR
jgi:hypothetical protein